jgi:hypothetical protein
MAPTKGKGMPTSYEDDPIKSMHFQDQYSDNGEYALWMHDVILMPVITVISLLVLGLLLYVVVRFNRRRNPVASKTTHNTMIEVIWTIVPVIVLVIIAVPSITLLARQYETPPADAVTINPYLGRDSAEPFLQYADKGIVILCRTSNAGSGEFQNLQVGDRKLYQIVAERVAGEWNSRGNCLLVVGATYPGELADIRARTGEMTFLVPGVGAQGGDVDEAVRNGRAKQGAGLVINSSRGILYAGSGEDFAAAARRATLDLRAAITQALRRS